MIHGLTDSNQLPRVGKIKLGIMKEHENGNSYPSETPYFVVPEEVTAVYGPEPTELDIMFPVDDHEAVFSQWYKWWGKGEASPRCVGDGKTARRRPDQMADVPDDGSIIERGTEENDRSVIGCPCPRLGDGCGPVGHLMVILPKVNRLGCYQIDIKAWDSIRQINSMIRIVMAQIGRISMVPMTIKRVPTAMEHQGRKTTHYLPQIFCYMNDEQVNGLIREASRPTTQLPAPEQVNDTPAMEPDGWDDPEVTDAVEANMNQHLAAQYGDTPEPEAAQYDDLPKPTPWIETKDGQEAQEHCRELADAMIELVGKSKTTQLMKGILAGLNSDYVYDRIKDPAMGPKDMATFQKRLKQCIDGEKQRIAAAEPAEPEHVVPEEVEA